MVAYEPLNAVTDHDDSHPALGLSGKSISMSHADIKVIADEDCENGKPAPDPYLLGLDKTNTTAEESLAFEDSITGASSAIGAGVDTVGILTTQSSERSVSD